MDGGLPMKDGFKTYCESFLSHSRAHFPRISLSTTEHSDHSGMKNFLVSGCLRKASSSESRVQSS